MSIIQQRLLPYIALIFFAIFCFSPSAKMPIVDRDSALFSQATKQMLETGHYFKINYQHRPRHLKPPGIYWLQALSVHLVGNKTLGQAWPYLLPSALGALIALLLVYGISNKIVGQPIAFLAALLMGASFLLFADAHLAVTDTMLLVSVIWMLGSLFRIYIHIKSNEKIPQKWLINFWLAMAFGILIKGLSPLFAILTMTLLIILDRDYKWIKDLQFSKGLLLLIIITFAWLIPLSVSSQSNFLWDMIHRDALPKVLAGQESHGHLPGFYLLILPLIFWPASLFFFITGVWTWQHRHRPEIQFLIAWFISIWLFFELIPTKMPEYLLPIFPALALLIASTLHKINSADLTKKSEIINRIYSFIWFGYSLAFAFIIGYLPYFLDHTFNYLAVSISLFIVAVAILALRFMLTDQLKKAAYLLIAGATLVYLCAYHFILPNLTNLWISNKVSTVLQSNQTMPLLDKTPLLSVVSSYSEPSLVFNLGTDRVLFLRAPHLLAKLEDKMPHLILTDERTLNDLKREEDVKRLSIAIIAKISGYNYSKGDWSELYLLNVLSAPNYKRELSPDDMCL